jgi:hypothetical protein
MTMTTYLTLNIWELPLVIISSVRLVVENMATFIIERWMCVMAENLYSIVWLTLKRYHLQLIWFLFQLSRIHGQQSISKYFLKSFVNTWTGGLSEGFLGTVHYTPFYVLLRGNFPEVQTLVGLRAWSICENVNGMGFVKHLTVKVTMELMVDLVFK